jgi:Leucine-rich repeat (LRR) protein
MNALWSLYNATDGANWVWYNPFEPEYFEGAVWSFTPSANPCSDQWQGITCNDQASHVIEIALPLHGLNGFVPPEIRQLAQLQGLDLDTNALSGTIPVEIGQLTQLQMLDLAYNLLSGRIPAEIGQLMLLQELDLYSNKLSGTIPTWIGQLTQLQGLDLDSNKLFGSIPAEIGQLTRLRELDLETNGLSGSIPVDIGRLTQLKFLNLYSNKLSGTIPVEIGQLVQLQKLGLGSNELSGTIPTWIGQLTQLQGLDLDSNKLSSSIPAEIGHLSQLQLLNLDSNKLSGSVPVEIGQLVQLHVLDLASNKLSGRIPVEIGQCALVEYVNVADNALTGSLPGELFVSANLSALIAGKNCFEGVLPLAVCGATGLVSLNMDGLHTARQCSKRQVPFTYVYGGAEAFHGTIPACVFELPLLTSLHLAGNGLTGTIPANFSVDTVLVDLVLSHNALVGPIPASIQQRAWDTLDLSYNRLGGTLLTSFGDTALAVSNTSATVYIKNNRLSGRIPSFLVNLAVIQILGTNLFSCGADRSDLPAHDADRDRYQCGSDAFVGHLIAALAILVVLVVALWVLRRRQCHRVDTAVNFAEKWVRDALLGAEKLPLGVAYLNTISVLLFNVAVWCAVAIVLCLLPWYAAAHSQYSTYAHAYAWVVSAAFLSGLVPAVTELALYCALMIAVIICKALLAAKMSDQKSGPSTVVPHEQPGGLPTGIALTPLWYQRLLHALFFVANLIVVLLVNVGFVAASLQADHPVLATSQILYTAFKIYWNMVCTPYMIDVVTAYAGRRSVSSSLVTIHMLLSILNNIVIPCLVVAVQSPSCFLNVFQASPTVHADYIVPGCVTFTTAIVNGSTFATTCTYLYPVSLSLQFEPHFSYSYQCSSSFITYYSPVFVLMGLTAGVLIPVAQAVSLYYLARAVPGTLWYRVLSTAVPRVLKPAALMVPPSRPCALPDTPATALQRLREERVFNGVTSVSALTTYLGILLTFGVVFPPLAVIMCATMWSVHWQTRLMLGKFVHDAQTAGAMHLVERLEQDCRSVVSMQTLQRVMFLITCICCCFYALFLFDTLGDARGAADSYWIFLVMALFPVVLYSLEARESRTGADVNDSIFEMATFSPGPTRQLEEGSSQDIPAAVNVSKETVRSAVSQAGISEAESAISVTMNALHSDA